MMEEEEEEEEEVEEREGEVEPLRSDTRLPLESSPNMAGINLFFSSHRKFDSNSSTWICVTFSTPVASDILLYLLLLHKTKKIPTLFKLPQVHYSKKSWIVSVVNIRRSTCSWQDRHTNELPSIRVLEGEKEGRKKERKKNKDRPAASEGV